MPDEQEQSGLSVEQETRADALDRAHSALATRLPMGRGAVGADELLIVGEWILHGGDAAEAAQRLREDYRQSSPVASVE